MSVVVCGTGRCGTRYLAKCLHVAGVRAGHEDVFTTEAVERGGPFDWAAFDVDVSWRAMPVVPLADVELVHLVRHPLATIASMVAVRFHEDPAVERVVRLACEGVYLHDDPVRRAAHHWAAWNAHLGRHARRRYRVEHLDVDALVSLGATADRAAIAVAAVPRSEHSWQQRGGRWRPVSWSELGPLEPVVRHTAQLCGYDDGR